MKKSNECSKYREAVFYLLLLVLFIYLLFSICNIYVCLTFRPPKVFFPCVLLFQVSIFFFSIASVSWIAALI